MTPSHRPRSRPRRRLLWLVAIAALLVAAGCADAEQLLDEQTGGTLDLSEVEVSIPDVDLNSPDFTVPAIVAGDINIDIDITEAPELPVIRFPDAIVIELRQITSDDVEVTETPDETIYTVSGTVLFDFDRADLRPEAIDI
ncbi:MAG: hypothetical protein AAFN30_02160, partial [Actinomycetota bacterium]